ncbi:MAG: hypothetical protein IKQ58_00235 [Prevotella sp.]|nr:hypothetical protein [Prevotella sp.]
MKTKDSLVKLMLMSLLTAATVFGFTACNDDDIESDFYGRSGAGDASGVSMPIGRTVLIYMAGKNDLTNNPYNKHYLNNDLEEIKEGSRKLSSTDCLLVFVRRYQKDNNLETPWLARIQNGEIVDSVSVTDMGITKTDARACDPEVMEQAMHYAYSHYPATRDYGLVLWSHSTGWLIENEMPVTRGYGLDNGNYVNGSGKWINIPTMKNILAKMPHLKFILADCCYFMCLESLYELRSVADYVIGSPAEIPGKGAPYQEIVPAMFESETFYTSIVEKYHASVNGNLPLSVVKMSEMDEVAYATANVLQGVKASLGSDYADLTGMIHYGHVGKRALFYPEDNFFFDAGDFISRYASESDYQYWKQALDKAVVMKRIGYKWDTVDAWRIFYVDFEMTEEKFHGVSMFIPQSPAKGKYAEYNENIKKMEWYSAVN